MSNLNDQSRGYITESPNILSFQPTNQQKLFQTKKRDTLNFNFYLDATYQENKLLQSHKRNTLNFNSLIDKTYKENELMQAKKRDESYFSPFENKSQVNFSQTCQQKNLFKMQAQKKLYRPDVNITCDAKNLKHKQTPSQTIQQLNQEKHISQDRNYLIKQRNNKNILFNYLKKHDRDRLKHQQQNILQFTSKMNRTNQYFNKNDFQITQLKQFNNDLHQQIYQFQSNQKPYFKHIQDKTTSNFSKSYMDTDFVI